jgi:hypothetical protein
VRRGTFAAVVVTEVGSARSVLYELCEARYAPMKNESGRSLATPVVPVIQSEHKHEALSFLIKGVESTKERV